MRNLLGIVVLASILVLVSGCLIYSNSHESRSGKHVSDTTLAQMKPGQTTTEWVAKVIGEPSTKDSLADGTEVWKWSYTESKDRNGAIFLLFAGNDRKEASGTVFAEFKNGVLTRWWRG